MRRGPAAVAAALLLLIAAVTAIVLLQGRSPPVPEPRPEAGRPPLMLLSTLPLVFPEHFALTAPASPTLKALQSRYRIVPISVADAEQLDHRRLLLMAQPRAQPAEALVDLDQWVRKGGRVLLLSDPALEWPSERPLGSLLRPPFAFADTGLLAHWGLRLDAPDQLGPAARMVDGREIRMESPGTLVATGRDCAVEASFIAHCRIGQGEATVIADADFLNPDSPDAKTANLGFLLVELTRLER
jgi:hypothetical protein